MQSISAMSALVEVGMLCRNCPHYAAAHTDYGTCAWGGCSCQYFQACEEFNQVTSIISEMISLPVVSEMLSADIISAAEYYQSNQMAHYQSGQSYQFNDSALNYLSNFTSIISVNHGSGYAPPPNYQANNLSVFGASASVPNRALGQIFQDVQRIAAPAKVEVRKLVERRLSLKKDI